MKPFFRPLGVLGATALMLAALASIGTSVSAASKCARDDPSNRSNWKEWGVLDCQGSNFGEGEWSLVEGTPKFVENHLYCIRVAAGERSSWKDANCTEAEASTNGFNQVELRWWQAALEEKLTTAVKVKEKGIFILSDLGTKVTVECEGKGAGTVGPENLSKQESLEVTKCVTLEGTCASPTAAAVGLPWESEVVTIAGVPRNEIKTKSGWQVTCSGLIKDTCEAEPGVPVLNVTKEATVVEESFPAAANVNVATCSVTKEKVGDVQGTFTVVGEGTEISLG